MGTVVVVVVLSLAGLALGVTVFASVRGVRHYLQARGKRLVTCPETHCAAAVELDAKGAGLKAFRGGTYLRLQDCSRWPEKQDCAQDCLTQVEALGQGCLVRNIVAGWYRAKTCVYCHKAVDDVAEWTGHMPALLAPDSKTVSWGDVPPANLPEIFATPPTRLLVVPHCGNFPPRASRSRDRPPGSMVISRRAGMSAYY